MASDFDLNTATPVSGFDLNSAKTLFQEPSVQYKEPEGDKDHIFIESTGETITAPKGVGREFAFIQNDDAFDSEPSTILDETSAAFNMIGANLALTSVIFGMNDPDDIADFYIDRKKAMVTALEKQPEYMKRFQDDFSRAEGGFEVAGAIFGNMRAIGRMSITNSPNAALPIIGNAVGAVGGIVVGGPVGGAVGFRVGGAVPSAVQEIGHEIDQIASELGYDTSTEAGFFGFVQDQEAMEAARIRASKKGVSQALIGMFFDKYAGKFIKAAKRSTGKVVGAVADVGVQSTGEFVEEAGAQFIGRGDIDFKDAVLESVISVPQSTATSVIGSTVQTQEKFESKIAKINEAKEIVESDIIDLNATESEIDVVSEPLVGEFEDAASLFGADSIVDDNGEDGQVLLPPESRFQGIVKVGRESRDSIDKILTPISTRIKNINKPLFVRVRKFEFETKRKIVEDMDRAVPFLKKFKKLKDDVRSDLGLALMNSDMDIINRIANDHNMANELANIGSMLDSIFERAKSVGMKTFYRADFFPRKVRDIDGLMAYFRNTDMWSVIDQAMQERESKVGTLNDTQRADVINTLMRGFQVEGVSLALRGQFKKRTIERVTRETARFYEDPMTALIRYINSANEAIETSILFGKAQSLDGSSDVSDSIGEFVSNMLKNGEIDDVQARALMDVFTARFNEKQMGWLGASIRDVLYVDVMGSPLNAITQISDMAVSMYNAGLLRSLSSIPRAMIDKTSVSLDDLGITNIAQEFDNGSPTSKLVDTVFELSGLAKVDRLGKRVVLEAHYKKLRSQARRGVKKLKAELDIMFDDRSNQVAQDLIDGNMTEDVKFLLFNRIMDFQPLSKSEMPEAYLRSGTVGKMMYMLKSFTIKQIDIYRREAIGLVTEGARTGNKGMVVQGMVNFIRLFGFWAAMNATAEFMKDLLRSMFGDSEMEEPPDYLIEGMWKALFLSRYQAEMFQKDAVDFTWGLFTPPTKWIESANRDLRKFSKGDLEPKDLRLFRSIPIGGELYWFWFGGGSEDDTRKGSRKQLGF